MNYTKTLLVMLGLMLSKIVSAQFCDRVILTLSSQPNADFTFDTFGKYIGGITQNGITQLKVLVDNSLTSNPDCRWNLVIYVDNSSNPATPTDEWELMSQHTLSGSTPKINQLQLRVRNRCNTSLTGNSFFNTNVLPGQPIAIISNTGITIPSGSCTTNVNGPGNYTTRYDEYTFDIDYRIIPGLSLKSGIYQLRLKYLLTEVM
jgi:hypothetical protein